MSLLKRIAQDLQAEGDADFPKPPNWEYLLKNHDPSVQDRARMEITIVEATIKALKAAGYALTVDDGGTGIKDLDIRGLMDEIFSVDEATLFARKDGKRSFVQFVLGNSGWDVINDYGTSLEAILEPVSEVANKLMEEEYEKEQQKS